MAEKLILNLEKINLILLKHLTLQINETVHGQNEIAYLKNFMTLNSISGGISDTPDVVKISLNDISDLPDSSKQLLSDKSDLADGSKLLLSDKSDLADGSKTLLSDKSDLSNGSKLLLSDKSDLANGSKLLLSDKSDLANGSKLLLSDKSDLPDSNKSLFSDKSDLPEGNKIPSGEHLEIREALKPLFNALLKIKNEEKAQELVYAVFENELKKAINYFAKSAMLANTLFIFYKNFMEALDEINSYDEKMKVLAEKIPLEETHQLPEKIFIDVVSVMNLTSKLREILPHSYEKNMCKTIALELLHLYETGKATSGEMKVFSQLSEGGIAKHLPKLQRLGFIAKQPPQKYVLTEKSKHILLKAFGVPKKK